MNAREKFLVKQALKDCQGATAGQKEIWIHDLKEKLRAHEEAVKNIGLGYAKDFVQAGRIFLRIQGVKTHNICSERREN